MVIFAAGNKIKGVLNMYSSKTLNCKDCGTDFEFTASEQEFYAEKGFTNEPVRCPSCRANRKAQVNSKKGGFGRTQQKRTFFTATCSSCGVETQVPFKPNGIKPVYCKECFDAR